MRFRPLALVLLFGSSSVLALACNAEMNPPAAPSTPAAPTAPATPVTTVVLDAGAPVATPAPTTLPVVAPPVSVASPDAGSLLSPPATGSGSAFASCSTTADCVAVPKNDCCHNGYLEAVNKGSVDAYHASAPKCDPKRKCPMFRILDKRVATCSTGTCVLVQPDGGTAAPTP